VKKIKLKLTDGNEGEVTVDIARHMIAMGHAVEVTKAPRQTPQKAASKSKAANETPASS